VFFVAGERHGKVMHDTGRTDKHYMQNCSMNGVIFRYEKGVTLVLNSQLSVISLSR